VRARRELNNHDPIDSINVLHPGCDNASWSATSCDEKSRRRAARHGAQRRAVVYNPPRSRRATRPRSVSLHSSPSSTKPRLTASITAPASGCGPA
jgi:hypothetical protein